MSVEEQQRPVAEGPVTRVLDNTLFRAINNEIQFIVPQNAAHVLDFLMTTTIRSISEAICATHVSSFQLQSLAILPSAHCDSIGSTIMQAARDSLYSYSSPNMSASISHLEYFMPATVTYKFAVRAFFPVSYTHLTLPTIYSV